MAQDLVDKLPQVQGRNVGVALADKVFVVPMGFLDLKTYALVALGLAWCWGWDGAVPRWSSIPPRGRT